MESKKILVVDPPSGWLHGFPDVIPDGIIGDDELFSQWLREKGYPEKLIPLALRHSRYWTMSEEEEDES